MPKYIHTNRHVQRKFHGRPFSSINQQQPWHKTISLLARFPASHSYSGVSKGPSQTQKPQETAQSCIYCLLILCTWYSNVTCLVFITLRVQSLFGQLIALLPVFSETERLKELPSVKARLIQRKSSDCSNFYSSFKKTRYLLKTYLEVTQSILSPTPPPRFFFFLHWLFWPQQKQLLQLHSKVLQQNGLETEFCLAEKLGNQME